MTARYAPRRRATTVTAAVLLAVGGLSVLAVGLSPQPAQTPVSDPLFHFLLFTSRQPLLSWITFDVVEAVGNVLLFAPVGALLYLLLPRAVWPATLLIGPVLSTAIELGQWLLLPARTASGWDILFNSLGWMLGVGVAALISLRRAAAAYRREREGALSGIPSPSA